MKTATESIGVSTLHDAIHLIHTSYQLLPEFLKTAEGILASALNSAGHSGAVYRKSRCLRH